MRKVVLTYGLIAGVIVGGLMVVSFQFWESGLINFDNSQVFGYGTMIIALSMIFFGIRSYRDNHSDGFISFGKGLKIGLLIALVAGVIYALTWEFYYQTNDTVRNEFMVKYMEHSIQKAVAGGATEAEVEAMRTQMQSMGELYKNPLIRFGFTLIEILPVGLLVSLISAAILKRKRTLAVG